MIQMYYLCLKNTLIIYTFYIYLESWVTWILS